MMSSGVKAAVAALILLSFDASAGEPWSARISHAIERQLAERNYLQPHGYDYLAGAVDTAGLVRGVLMAADRSTRNSRIASAGRHLPDPLPSPRTDILWPQPAGSGGVCAADDYSFVKYLIDKSLKEDARTLLSRSCYAESDTLHYMRGLVSYSLMGLDSALGEFGKVTEQSPLYVESAFYCSACAISLGRYDCAKAVLDACGGGPLKELAALHRAGMALLEEDREGFERASAGFGFSNARLSGPENEMMALYDRAWVPRARKSPLAAAALSTVVPGLGKIYAGRTGEGVAAFVLTGAGAAVTADCWSKKGGDNWETVGLAALTGLFHIADIYGSWMSVSVYHNELRDATRTAVLYNINIPLRSIFR